MQNASCIESYCFNNAQVTSSAAFIPTALSKMPQNNLNIVPVANLQNDVSLKPNTMTGLEMLDSFFSQLETNKGNIHQGHGVQHTGHGMKHPGHIIKQPAHGIKHLRHGIKQPAHGISHPGHVIKHQEHGQKHPGHGIKQPTHGINHPGHKIGNARHGIKHSTDEIKHQGHGIKHLRHGIKQPAHGISHPGHVIKQQQHGQKHPGHGIKRPTHGINHPGHEIRNSRHGIKHSVDEIKHQGHGTKQSANLIKNLGHGIRQPGHGIKHPTHGIKHPQHEINQQGHGINHGGREMTHTQDHMDSSHQIGMSSVKHGHVVPPDSHSPSHVNTEHPNSAVRKRPELHAVNINQGLSPISLNPIEPVVNDVHLHQAKPVGTPTNIHHAPLPVEIAAVIPLDGNVHHHQGTETLPVEPDVNANPSLLPENVVAAIVPQDMLQTLPVQPAGLDHVADAVKSGVLHKPSGPGLVIVGTGPFVLEQPSNTVVDPGQGNLDTVITDHIPHLDGSGSRVQPTDLSGHSGSVHHHTLSGDGGVDIDQIKAKPVLPDQSKNALVGADQGNSGVLSDILGLDPVLLGDQTQVNPVHHDAHIHNTDLASPLPLESITNDHTAIHHGHDMSAHSRDHTGHSHSSSNVEPTLQKLGPVQQPKSSSESMVRPPVSSVPSDTLSTFNFQSDLFANTGQLASFESVLVDARNLQQAALRAGAINNVQSSIAPGTLEVLPNSNQPVNVPGARAFDSMNPQTGTDAIAQVPVSRSTIVRVSSAQNFRSLKPHLHRTGIQRSPNADRRQENRAQPRVKTSSTRKNKDPFVNEHGNPILTFGKLYNIKKVKKVTEKEAPNLGSGVPGREMAGPIGTLPQAVADQGWMPGGSTVAPTIVTLSPQRKAELKALSNIFLTNIAP